MSGLDQINQLISNKELALTIGKIIPQDSMYMRMNGVWGMFYIYHGAEKQGGRPSYQPLRYLRYKKGWVNLNIADTWEQFVEKNAIFSVAAFKLALAKKYPVEVIGTSRAWEIADNQPPGATHYNVLSNKYHREGGGIYTETCTGSFGGKCLWVESSHYNENLESEFLNLDHLLKKLQCQSIYQNYALD